MKEVNINNNEQINDMDKLVKEDVINIYTNSVSLAVGYYDFQFLFREQYPSFTLASMKKVLILPTMLGL